MNIKIEPEEHKGWKLKYSEQHDSKNNWTATKACGYLFAETPKALIAAIDEREELTVRLKKPLKVLYRGQYDNTFTHAEVHAVCKDVVYIRTPKGEVMMFLSQLRPGEKQEYGRGIMIHDTKANHRLLQQGIKLRRQASELTKKAEAMVLQVSKVTDADILIAAKD